MPALLVHALSSPQRCMHLLTRVRIDEQLLLTAPPPTVPCMLPRAPHLLPSCPQVLRNLSQQEDLEVRRRFVPFVEQMVQLVQVGGAGRAGWLDALYDTSDVLLWCACYMEWVMDLSLCASSAPPCRLSMCSVLKHAAYPAFPLLCRRPPA